MHPGAKCSNEAIPLAEGPAVAAGPFTGVPSMNNSLEVGCCRNCFGGRVGPRIGADDLMASERVARVLVVTQITAAIAAHVVRR